MHFHRCVACRSAPAALPSTTAQCTSAVPFVAVSAPAFCRTFAAHASPPPLRLRLRLLFRSCGTRALLIRFVTAPPRVAFIRHRFIPVCTSRVAFYAPRFVAFVLHVERLRRFYCTRLFDRFRLIFASYHVPFTFVLHRAFTTHTQFCPLPWILTFSLPHSPHTHIPPPPALTSHSAPLFLAQHLPFIHIYTCLPCHLGAMHITSPVCMVLPFPTMPTFTPHLDFLVATSYFSPPHSHPASLLMPSSCPSWDLSLRHRHPG